MNIANIKLFDDSYYQEHTWPKLGVLLIAGVACLVTGIFFKRKRQRDARKEQEYLDSLSSKFDTVKQLAFWPARSPMFIPLQYWSLVYFADCCALYDQKQMKSDARA